MSEYVPTTDEVETAFHEFASAMEAADPGTYEHAPEFTDWKQAMYGFRRWIAAHDRTVKAEALRDAASRLAEIDTRSDAVFWDGGGYERVTYWLKVLASRIEGADE